MGILIDAAHRHATPEYMGTKAEIVEYYRDTYGERDWRKHYTADTIKALGLEDTKKVRNTIGRQVQGDRWEKAARTKAAVAQYQALGKKLPPTRYVPMERSVTIKVKGTQVVDAKRKTTRTRTFSATFSGPDAYAITNATSDEEILRDILKANGYPDDVVDTLTQDPDYMIAPEEAA